jgi:hypothetical protein
MPKCKPCLGQVIKDAILDTFPGLSEVIEEVPTCEQEAGIEFCLNEPRESGGSGTGRKKRAPSKYNLFTGKCMKTGKGMKDCAAEWKAQKEGA